jgi:hypothetical protein
MRMGQKIHLKNITLSETDDPVIISGVVSRVFKKSFAVNVGGKMRYFSCGTEIELSASQAAWKVIFSVEEIKEIITKKKEIDTIRRLLTSKLAYSIQIEDLHLIRRLIEQSTTINIEKLKSV